MEAFQVTGKNAKAPFTLKLHRGDGMTLLAMNWRKNRPPRDFVGWTIEYREPGGDRFYALKNRIRFPKDDGSVDPNSKSTRLAPIQKFRWVHFPRNAELKGKFTYRVTPAFMGKDDALSFGEPQEAAIELRRETYPGKLNVAFTRGFVASQAFVDKFVTEDHGMQTLIPSAADKGLDFVPNHPRAAEALEWMGFEARKVVHDLLDEAIADETAKVEIVAFDLSERDIVQKLQALGKRLRIIIDDSKEHGEKHSGESQAARRLKKAGAKVKRHHMSKLQHNKTIVVDGKKCKAVLSGSTNYTWRGLFVQNNNAFVVRGKAAVATFHRAFEDYWAHDNVGGFGATESALEWASLGVPGIDAKVTFAPRRNKDAILQGIADDAGNTKSSLFYSLAFLSQTKGSIRDAITTITENEDIFVYGMADRKVGGFDLQTPTGNVPPVFAAHLAGDLPEPFKSEPSGLPRGGSHGTRMHHKFLVIDFDRPTARVYLGSHNFSNAAETGNGDNIVLVKDRRIAVSYMIEALRIFDHYHFRVREKEADEKRERLQLQKPPRPGEEPWFEEHYSVARKIKDRLLFA